MRKSLFRGKSSRTKIYTVITAVGLVLLLGINLLLTYFGGRGMLFLDLTREGLYSLSDRMVESCDELMDLPEGEGITVTFCSDPDVLVSSTATRIVSYMAMAMQLEYDNFEVKTYNIRYNPTAVSAYKTTSRSEIKYNDVIISYGGKYRVINANAFWTQSNDVFYSFNGEYKLATAIASLTAISQPKAYFLTDHGESYYDPKNPDSEMSVENAALADLLTECGFEIRTASLEELVKIPEDCAMLVINRPTEDFSPDESSFNSISYVSPTEKLDRYLIEGGGTIIVNKPYDTEPLPVLEAFLEDWGIAFSPSYVVDEENELDLESSDGKTFAAEYDSSEENFGYTFYGDFVGLASAPKMVFSDTGYLYCAFGDGTSRHESGYDNTNRTYAHFICSYDTATAYTAENALESSPSAKALAAISARTKLDSYTGETSYAYIFATASESFYSNEILGNSSYANYDILLSVFRNISRTDRYADIDLGGLSGNSKNRGGKILTVTTLSDSDRTLIQNGKSTVYDGISGGAIGAYTTVIALIPVAALVVGAVTFIKRRFL